MSTTIRRVVRLANTSLAVEYEQRSGSPAARIVSVVLPGVPVDGASPPSATLVLESTAGDRRLRLRRTDAVLYDGIHQGELAGLLLDEVARTLATDCRGGLLFHAAAVGWQGRGVLLPGSTGSGKTMLAAWLIRQGLTCLNDEIAYVVGHAVQSFPRPLAFKPAALPVLRRWISAGDEAAQTLATPLATLVAPRLLGQGQPPIGLQVEAVVFPDRQDGACVEWRPLSPAETSLGLMASLVNARNLEGHGFPDVVRLARRVRGFRLTYGDVEAVVPEPLVTLLGSASLRAP